MSIWPFNKRKTVSNKVALITNAQARPEYWRPYDNTRSYLPMQQSAEVMGVIRQALPILDTALDKLVKLTGKANVVWDSDRVQQAWDLWSASVKVAPLGRSVNSWLNGQQERALMFGTAASEIVIDPTGRQIAGFQYVPSSQIRLRCDPENPLEVIVAQQQPGIPDPVVLDRDFVFVSANEPEDASPYGESLFAQCPFIAELLIEMAHAEKMNWVRLGTPSHAILLGIPDNVDASVDVGATVQALLDNIEGHWTEAMTSRQTKGTVKDFFGAGQIDIKTIGADAKELNFEVPWRAALEQIISVTHLPPYMLGMSWSTTERLSEEQAQALEDVILDYQADYTPMIEWAADWWARINGYANVGRRIVWPMASLRDRVELARAESMTAQAAKIRQQVGRQLWADGVYDQSRYAQYVTGDEDVELAQEIDEPSDPVDRGSAPALALAAKATAACNHDHSKQHRGMLTYGVSVDYGEDTPHDDRILDLINDFYRKERKALQSLRDSAWSILHLPNVTSRAVEEIPFEWTAAQEEAFVSEVELFLRQMAGDDRSKLGFVQGSGLIQDANVAGFALGAVRSIEMLDAAEVTVDVGRNSAAVQAMLERGFDLLSENGRMRLEDILPELRGVITDAVANGENPLAVARELSARFDQYRDWEFQRLARTEIARAQNEGQMAEFAEQGVDTSGVDGNIPPFHPACLCDLSIERDSDTGAWKTVYMIAATACEECQSYAQ